MKRTRDDPSAPPAPGSWLVCHCLSSYIAARRVIGSNERARAPARPIGSDSDRHQNAHGITDLYRDGHTNPSTDGYAHSRQPTHSDRHAHSYQNAHGNTDLYRDDYANPGTNSHTHADKLVNSLDYADKYPDSNRDTDALSNTFDDANQYDNSYCNAVTDQHKYADPIVHTRSTFCHVDAITHPHANAHRDAVGYAVRDSNAHSILNFHMDLDGDADSNAHRHAVNLAFLDRDQDTHINIYTNVNPFTNAHLDGDRNANAAPDSRKRTGDHV